MRPPRARFSRHKPPLGLLFKSPQKSRTIAHRRGRSQSSSLAPVNRRRRCLPLLRSKAGRNYRRFPAISAAAGEFFTSPPLSSPRQTTRDVGRPSFTSSPSLIPAISGDKKTTVGCARMLRILLFLAASS